MGRSFWRAGRGLSGLGRARVDWMGFEGGPWVDWAGPGRALAAHIMSSNRLALATQSSARGSEAAMIMHMKGRPVRRSVG